MESKFEPQNYDFSTSFTYPSTNTDNFSHANYYNNYSANYNYTYMPFDTENQVNNVYPSYTNQYCNYNDWQQNYLNSPAQTESTNYYDNSTPSQYQQVYYQKNFNQSYSVQFNNSNESFSNNSLNYDSAYQSQLDLTPQSIQPKFENNLEQLPCKKRKREDLAKCVENIFTECENLNYQKVEQTKISKRPKILKLKIEENQENQLHCPQCSLVFFSKAKLLMHQHKFHNKGSSSVCPICYKQFGNQANTLVHLRGHTQEKTYKCQHCDNAFYDSSTLKKHMRTHTGEKPYECHLCLKKFTQSGNLKRHLMVHQKYEEEDNEQETYQITGELEQNQQLNHPFRFLQNEYDPIINL